MSLEKNLILACFAMIVLILIVALRMYASRVQEMKERRIHPQAIATSLKISERLHNVQAADNFKNLFEVPVIFYALVAVALATKQVTGWLVTGAWLFVLLRYLHSFIHCTYNKVMHRFVVFGAGLFTIAVLWIAFVATLSV